MSTIVCCQYIYFAFWYSDFFADKCTIRACRSKQLNKKSHLYLKIAVTAAAKGKRVHLHVPFGSLYE